MPIEVEWGPKHLTVDHAYARIKPIRVERSADMETIAVQIELVPRQIEQLQQLAHDRRLSPSAVLELAVEEWLDNQARLERARLLMRI